MKLKDMYGATTMEISVVERRGDAVMASGKAFGAMPITVYIEPEEAWEARRLLSWSVVRYLPILLAKGWRRNRKRETVALKDGKTNYPRES